MTEWRILSHNTWDYTNALGRPPYDNIESWEASHFEAKDHLYNNLTLPKSWLVHYSSFIVHLNSFKFGMHTLIQLCHGFLLFVIKKVNISLKILWF
jgi:hypothetical protein